VAEPQPSSLVTQIEALLAMENLTPRIPNLARQLLAEAADHVTALEAQNARLRGDFSHIEIPDGFRRWGGFPCPVLGEQPIDVIFSSKPTTVRRITGRTGSLGVSDGCWWWHPEYDKIIAVRYVPSSVEPPEPKPTTRKLFRFWPFGARATTAGDA